MSTFSNFLYAVVWDALCVLLKLDLHRSHACTHIHTPQKKQIKPPISTEFRWGHLRTPPTSQKVLSKKGHVLKCCSLVSRIHVRQSPAQG